MVIELKQICITVFLLQATKIDLDSNRMINFEKNNPGEGMRQGSKVKTKYSSTMISRRTHLATSGTMGPSSHLDSTQTG